MTKAQELRALFRHVFSVNRRKKLKILIRERLMGVPQLFKAKPFDDESLPADPAANKWHSHDKRAFDLEYFALAAPALVEDYQAEDGLIHTKHEYLVHELFGATSYTNDSTHRSVYDRTGQRLDAISYTRKGARVGSALTLPVARTVSGTTANLYGNVATSEGNYLHWFVDALARLFLIEKFHDLSEIDYVLVPPLKYDFHWDSLAALGFDRSRIIEMRPLECLRFERLLASSAPRGKGSTVCPGWVIDRYLATFSEKASTVSSVGGKRVYISRRDAPNRMFINEHEVCEFFQQRGFDIVELTPLNLWSKIAVFRDADVIVGQTGAGLTNLMFCHSDAKVLELVDKRFVHPLYASFALYKNATHLAHYFSNESALGRVNATVVKSSLDLDKLEISLARLEAA